MWLSAECGLQQGIIKLSFSHSDAKGVVLYPAVLNLTIGWKGVGGLLFFLRFVTTANEEEEVEEEVEQEEEEEEEEEEGGREEEEVSDENHSAPLMHQVISNKSCIGHALFKGYK